MFGAFFLFRYHCGKEEQIEGKIKSIQCKTNLLKTMAVSVPELALLNSVDKPKVLTSSSINAKNVAVNKAGTSGASVDIENAAVATSSPMIPAEKLTSTMPTAANATAASVTSEGTLLICVNNRSLVDDEDDTTSDRVEQQSERAVIVTVIEIFIFFSLFPYSVQFVC